MQYSGNHVNTEENEVEDVDEDTQTLLQCLNTITKLKSKSSNYRAKTFQTIHAHINYYAYNFNSSAAICIVDSGGDSHVGGMHGYHLLLSQVHWSRQQM